MGSSNRDTFAGTMPVSERNRFDLAKLEAYLREHIDGFAGALEVEQFKGGQSNPTFRLSAGGTRTGRPALVAERSRVIAALHKIGLQPLGLADYGKTGDYLARQIARWTKQYRASETEKIEAMERLIEWLPENIPADNETTIV